MQLYNIYVYIYMYIYIYVCVCKGVTIFLTLCGSLRCFLQKYTPMLWFHKHPYP
jgi:hypothetical protein